MAAHRRHRYLLTNDLLEVWQGAGLSASIIAKLRPIAGTVYPTLADYRLGVRALITTDEVNAINAMLGAGDHVPTFRMTYGQTVYGTYFNGYQGQWLLIVPAKQLVAVRMRQFTPEDVAAAVEQNADNTFLSDAYHLVPDAVAADIGVLARQQAHRVLF